MQDAPWFVSRKCWDIENDKTIIYLQNIPLFEALQRYFSNEDSYTYPSHQPREKIDYIFAGKGITIIKEKVYKKASTLSDHLPIWTQIKLID